MDLMDLIKGINEEEGFSILNYIIQVPNNLNGRVLVQHLQIVLNHCYPH